MALNVHILLKTVFLICQLIVFKYPVTITYPSYPSAKVQKAVIGHAKSYVFLGFYDVCTAMKISRPFLLELEVQRILAFSLYVCIYMHIRKKSPLNQTFVGEGAFHIFFHTRIFVIFFCEGPFSQNFLPKTQFNKGNIL